MTVPGVACFAPRVTVSFNLTTRLTLTSLVRRCDTIVSLIVQLCRPAFVRVP